MDDINIVEYLQPVNTEGLLQKVRAAIYLSLDELWPVPSNIMLVATFLDPHFKNFDWCNGNDKDKAKELVQVLYGDARSKSRGSAYYAISRKLTLKSRDKFCRSTS